MSTRSNRLPLESVTLYKNDLALHERRLPCTTSSPDADAAPNRFFDLRIPKPQLALVQDTLCCRAKNAEITVRHGAAPKSKTSPSNHKPYPNRFASGSLGEFLLSCRGARISVSYLSDPADPESLYQMVGSILLVESRRFPVGVSGGGAAPGAPFEKELQATEERYTTLFLYCEDDKSVEKIELAVIIARGDRADHFVPQKSFTFFFRITHTTCTGPSCSHTRTGMRRIAHLLSYE